MNWLIYTGGQSSWHALSYTRINYVFTENTYECVLICWDNYIRHSCGLKSDWLSQWQTKVCTFSSNMCLVVSTVLNLVNIGLQLLTVCEYCDISIIQNFPEYIVFYTIGLTHLLRHVKRQVFSAFNCMCWNVWNATNQSILSIENDHIP